MNSEHTQINKEKNEKIWTKPKRIKKQPEKYREPETASATLMKYLLQKKETETKTESVVHPVDAFLSSLSATLKTLDPYNLNLAKSRIFNVVQEIELNQIY